ncbi:diaminopimelate decarboxylase [Candidatus Marinamargulisbacteria bacterium SCGC AAA071-K20]|nr:diaminopimelate decarboxylase [Candidatus Marinamargulisbacteria bacterium SCGC AAA071-K20]
MSIYPNLFKLNSNNKYTVGDVSIESLVLEYGSPLYILDHQTIASNVASYRDALAEHCPNSRLIYAGKANLTVGLVNLLSDMGMGLDVVSGGELHTALQSKIDPKNIYFHGNNKSELELEMAIKHQIYIIVDNITELNRIFNISQKENKHVNILVRVKPGIEAHTHEYIKTGQEDSKFGVGIEEFYSMVAKIAREKLVDLVGIHSHIGSQIFQTTPFLDLVDIHCSIIKKVKDDHGIDLKISNIGGGIGIRYTEDDAPPEISKFIESVSKQLKMKSAELGIAEPTLLLEPGRSIIGNAGMTVYKIGTIKKVTDDRTYLFVDGGMADNPRPMMYQALHTFGLSYRSDRPKQKYVIAGKYCESGDILAEDVELSEPKVDDLLMVFGTGAYNYSMASNYNRSCKPAVVLVKDGATKLLVERETFGDVIARDIV